MSIINVYFDTEFTGLVKDTNLISIGLITDNNDYFYAEMMHDSYSSKLNTWLNENVIKNLKFGKNGGAEYGYGLAAGTIDIPMSKNQLFIEIKWWLQLLCHDRKNPENSDKNSIQLISDVCHYDMVLFADIFGGALNIPSFISPVCYDINQDIAKHYSISQMEAFNKSREDILKENNIILNDTSMKHNSLFDAEVIQAWYHILNKKENE